MGAGVAGIARVATGAGVPPDARMATGSGVAPDHHDGYRLA